MDHEQLFHPHNSGVETDWMLINSTDDALVSLIVKALLEPSVRLTATEQAEIKARIKAAKAVLGASDTAAR
jgi:hypothetical protein